MQDTKLKRALGQLVCGVGVVSWVSMRSRVRVHPFALFFSFFSFYPFWFFFFFSHNTQTQMLYENRFHKQTTYGISDFKIEVIFKFANTFFSLFLFSLVTTRI